MTDKAMENGETLHPRDKGWSWAVMIGSFGVNCIMVGYIRSFGLLFVAFQEKYGYSASLVSAVSGTQSVAFCICSFVSMNVLLKRFNVRTLCAIGVVLETLAVALAESVAHSAFLVIWLGGLFGMGNGLKLFPHLFLVAQYFLKHRSVAMILATCGTSLGGFVFPIATKAFLQTYGLQGTLLMLSGLLLHQMMFVLLFTPPSDYGFASRNNNNKNSNNAAATQSEQRKLNERADGNAPAFNQRPMNKLDVVEISRHDVKDGTDMEIFLSVDEEEKNTEVNKTLFKNGTGGLESGRHGNKQYHHVSQPCELEYLVAASDGNCPADDLQAETGHTCQVKNTSLLEVRESILAASFISLPMEAGWRDSMPTVVRSRTFWTLMLYFIGAPVGSAAPSIFLPPFLRDKGMGEDVAAFFLTISAVMDILGRISPAFILQMGWMTPSTFSFLPMTIGCVLYSLTFLLHDYTDFLVFSLVYGSIGSCFFATQTLVVIDVLGMQHLASAMGFYAIATGFAVGVSYPFGGYLRDVTGTYLATYLYFAAMFLLAIISMVAVLLLKRRAKA